MSWFPGVSQLKSTFQLITGDVKGVVRTQKEFFQQCPGVSQVTATAQLICGDLDGAKQTFKKGVSTINNTLDSIPVVGHTKALVHLALDDEEGAEKALMSSSRTTCIHFF